MRDFQSGVHMMTAINLEVVNVEGVEPAIVIAALLNARRGDGLSVPGLATPDSVTRLFEAYQRSSFNGANSMWDRDFLNSIGLEMYLSKNGKALHSFFYDSSYGEGLARIVLEHVRSSKGKDRWSTSHLVYYKQPASMTSILLVIAAVAALIALTIMMR